MKKIVLASPIWSDDGVLQTPSLSGGGWGSTLDNLKDGRLSKVARSTDATVASTKFLCDLGVTRAVRALALPKHTISEAGTVRMRGLSSVPVLDEPSPGGTGWLAVNTPTRTLGYTCADGVALELLTDNNGTQQEYPYKTIPFTGNGQKVFAFRTSKGDSPPASGSQVVLRDATLGVNLGVITLTWVGDVLTATPSTGTLLSSTPLGNGDYRVVALSNAVTAANLNQIWMQPCAVAAEQGNVYYGDILAWDATADPLVYETGYQPALPAGTTAEDREGFNSLWLDVPDEAQSARYWQVNVNDTTNVDGHVDLARLVIAGAYDPTYNFSYGARLQPVTRTTMEESDGTDDFYDERPQRRELTFSLGHMQQTEAFGQALKLQMRHGLAKQLFVVIDPDDDATLLYQRAFLATLRELSALEYVVADRHAVGYALREVL